jgi:hypothetical protein
MTHDAGDPQVSIAPPAVSRDNSSPHPPLSLEGLRDQFRANMRGHASNLPNAHCTRLCLAEVDRFLDALEPFLQCASARREEPKQELESRMDSPGAGSQHKTPTAMETPAGSGHYYGKPLGVRVENGRLVIEIGIDVLAYAAAFSDWANPFDERCDDYIRSFAIANPEQFAKDVQHMMLQEREDGSTPLSDFIDTASEEAVNDGSLGLDENEHTIKHGEFHAVETWAVAKVGDSKSEDASTVSVGEAVDGKQPVANSDR